MGRAPGCAMIMGEWGADVIKVESPGGDATRNFFPDTPDSPGNPVFSMENRGKRGVVLDTSRPEGREALIALLQGADVFVTNVRPGALARSRLDYRSSRTNCPISIYASVSGYGLQGEEIDTGLRPAPASGPEPASPPRPFRRTRSRSLPARLRRPCHRAGDAVGRAGGGP